MLLQKSHGLFPRIIGKGDNVLRLMELLLRMRSEATANENPKGPQLGMMPSASVESLILIDRDIDFATVLLTQLTYEGLIEETYGIKDNQAEVDTSIVGPGPGQPQQTSGGSQQSLKRKILLDSSDKLHDQLQDTNFAVVGSLLNKVARRLESDYESRHGAKSTSELREFVSKLPAYQAEQQSLKIHTGLAEDMMKYTRTDTFTRMFEVQQNIAAGSDPSYQHETIEELIARDTPLPTILRLLCLESCINGGIRQKDLDSLKRQVLHAYGYQHLLTLDALEKMQLLQLRTSINPFSLPGGTAVTPNKTNYNYLRKVLRLIVDEVNEQNPEDISYVYSGYAPLSIRLIQCILQKQYLLSFTKGTNAATNNSISNAAHGWQGFEDALKSVKGETFNKTQKGEEAATKARQILTGAGGSKKTVVLMFVGGITYTEIAAIRFIAKQEEARRRILICTTGIISGDLMMKAAIEKGSFGKS